MARTSLKIFQYIAELDCFVVTEHYRRVADYLGLDSGEKHGSVEHGTPPE